MATEDELKRRREEARRIAQGKRGLAAVEAGHPEWVALPKTVAEARRAKKTYVFTGRACEFGHIARRFAHNERCVECVRPTPPEVSPEQHSWRQRFNALADVIEETGRLHYLRLVGSQYRVVETNRVIKFDNVREACSKAARLTAQDGELRCVMPGATRMVVKRAVGK